MISQEIKEQIAKDADEKYPFIWPLNSRGEEMVQRVGQMPHGWGKHQKIVKAYIAGAEKQAGKAGELVSALEMTKDNIHILLVSPPSQANALTVLQKLELVITEALNKYNQSK